MKPTNDKPDEREHGSFLFVRRRRSRPLSGEEKPGLSAELLLILAFVVFLAVFAVLLFTHLLHRS